MKNHLLKIVAFTWLLITLAGCKYFGSNGPFQLNPGLKKVYKYSLLKTTETYPKYAPVADSSVQIPARKNIDTFRLSFSLENTSVADSLLTYQLTFIDFFKPKRNNIVFRFNGPSQPFLTKDPFALYDSIGSIIRGKSIEVVTNHKGIVRLVTGQPELVTYIATRSNETERHVRSMISDYLGVNAIKDLLNRFFSATPGFRVKEGDKWIRNVLLVTKAPVKLSDLYMFDQQSADTAYVSIQSLVSATQSDGGTMYMKGKGKGIAIINLETGMPYLYETRSENETNTSQKQYEYITQEHFLVKRLH